MSLSDLDRAIRLLERAATEPTIVGTPVVIVDVTGDYVRDALSALRSMRERAVEGWAWKDDSDEPHVWVVYEEASANGVPVLLIPAERSETTKGGDDASD